MLTALYIVIVMSAIGLIFGLVLGFANKKLAVKMDPLIHIVEDILPKGQCGACGFPGCQAYAEAVVTNPDVPPDLCIPGKAEVAKKVAELTGKHAEDIIAQVAHIKCANPIDLSVRKYKYSGIKDCVAASILHLGPKDCQFGCIGLGTCIKHCPFGAIKMNRDGLPVVNSRRCTGCGKCQTACPKKIIEMIPSNSAVIINCNSRNKAADARKHCKIPCLGCGICAKQCPHGAIRIEQNLALVDHNICIEKCTQRDCVAKCPTGAIRTRIVNQDK